MVLSRYKRSWNSRLNSRKIVVSVLNSVLIGFIITLLILTAIETANLSDYSFKLAILNQRLDELRCNNSILETEVNQRESLATIDNQFKNLEAFKISTIEYVLPEENTVVVK